MPALELFPKSRDGHLGPNSKVWPNSAVAGLPAVPLRELSGPAREHVTSASDHYQALMTLYEHLGRPVGTAGEDS